MTTLIQRKLLLAAALAVATTAPAQMMSLEPGVA